MAKKNDVVAIQKKNTTLITLRRKAKRVLQSNGLQYFLEWADKDTSGGLRKKAFRGKMKLECPKLYAELVEKGKALNRKMDRPKPVEDN